MALSYLSIIAQADLQAGALGSSKLVSDATLSDELDDLLEGVSRRVEDYLARDLVVRLQTDRAKRIVWETDEGLDHTAGTQVSAYARQWPPLEVTAHTSPSGATSADPTVHADGRKLTTTLSSSSNILTVSYFAGYRREDQDLAELQTEIPTLTVLPGILPADIRRVAVRLAFKDVLEQSGKRLGVQRTLQQVASAAIQTESPDRDFERRELDKLTRHRYFR